MNKVIVAIDESEESYYALQWLLQNLHMQMQSLDIIHVLEPFPYYVFPGVPVFPATSTITQSANRVRQENAQTLLAHAANMCARAQVKASTSILEGDPKEIICEAAEQTHADLIVVGSRGLGKIKRAFLGSVSDYVVHHAKCPVIIVKPPDASQR